MTNFLEDDEDDETNQNNKDENDAEPQKNETEDVYDGVQQGNLSQLGMDDPTENVVTVPGADTGKLKFGREINSNNPNATKIISNQPSSKQSVRKTAQRKSKNNSLSKRYYNPKLNIKFEDAVFHNARPEDLASSIEFVAKQLHKGWNQMDTSSRLQSKIELTDNTGIYLNYKLEHDDFVTYVELQYYRTSLGKTEVEALGDFRNFFQIISWMAGVDLMDI